MARAKPGRACPICSGDLDAGCHDQGCVSQSQAAIRGGIEYVLQGPRGAGRPKKNCPPVGYSRHEIAEKYDIGDSLLDEAIAIVLRFGHDSETVNKIDEGFLVVGRVFDAIKREKRRNILLADIEPPPDGRFQLILADPPWQYRDDGVRGAAESHYPTTPIANLNAMRPMIDRLSEDDSVLVMWAVSPLLPDALTLMDSWGFTYKSSAIWHKTGAIGMGHTFRIDHEFLLIGIRGQGIAVNDRAVRSMITAPIGKHSVKPVAAYGVIERLWPQDVSKIELFARASRPGWAAWGAEAPPIESEAA